MKFRTHIKSSFFGSIVYDLYKKTGLYRSKQNSFLEAKFLKREEISLNEAKIMNDIFSNQYVVHNGPFKGLKYIETSNCSTLLPKILGSYEEPIQKWIVEVIESSYYDNIIDIGSAEGYYACGFALKMPNAVVSAYDINANARSNLKELKALNKLKNVEIHAECTHAELNGKCGIGTLVFCDIEGYEKILLDPERSPNLKYADLIVESHDWVVPNITEDLITRFLETHQISIVVDYPNRIHEYDSGEIPSSDLDYIIDENRPSGMKFLYLRSFERTS